MPLASGSVSGCVTDPPYYDSVPYGDLSDFFYVWLKRSIGESSPQVFPNAPHPKRQELIAYYRSGEQKIQKPPEWYEAGMQGVFSEMFRVLNQNGCLRSDVRPQNHECWESLIRGLLRSGLIVTSSWPLHTERPADYFQSAQLLSPAALLSYAERRADRWCWHLGRFARSFKPVAKERLDFFWSQGIRGADFFISAIGPALSVFGQYVQVKKLDGDRSQSVRFLSRGTEH